MVVLVPVLVSLFCSCCSLVLDGLRLQLLFSFSFLLLRCSDDLKKVLVTDRLEQQRQQQLQQQLQLQQERQLHQQRLLQQQL